jgi:hypothetical protein
MRTWRAYSHKKPPASEAVGSSTVDNPTDYLFDDLVNYGVNESLDESLENSLEDSLEDSLDDPIDDFLEEFLDISVVDPIDGPTARPQSGSSVTQFVSRLDNYIPFTQDVVQFVLLSLAFG